MLEAVAAARRGEGDRRGRGWGGRGAAGAVHQPGGRRPHAAQVPAVQGAPVLLIQFIDRVLDISVAH